ncbi:hypothetical protein ACTS9K_08055 [Empedobacter sp. ULE_I145]
MKKRFIFTVTFLLSVAVFAQKGETKTKYFYAVGWEYLPKADQSLSNRQPVVSNVFATRCKEDYLPIDTGITNELNSFYSAYYGKRRGFHGLNRMIAFGPYDTWDEAEKHRRKSIADYNQNWNPILLRDFSVSCD